MYVVLLVSPGDWLPTFLWLVQGDFHVPSSNSKIKKGPSVLFPSLPSLLQSFVLMVSDPNSSSLMCSGLRWVYQIPCAHLVISLLCPQLFPALPYSLACLFPQWWHADSILLYSLSSVPAYTRKYSRAYSGKCAAGIGSRRCTQTVLLAFFLLHRFSWLCYLLCS